MTGSGKYIGINQRVPFEVLDSGIAQYLNEGNINKTDLVSHMKEFTKGANRAVKAASYAHQILTRQQSLLTVLKKALGDSSYANLNVDDRKTLVLCLLSLTYPITFDLLVALAAGFKVQSQINKAFINQKIAAIYGSNRTMEIALDALMPMVIELNAIKRDKLSIYSLAEKTPVSHPFIKELLVYVDIKLSGSKSMLLDDVLHRPWYLYFDLPAFKNRQFTLLKYTDGIIGGGYLAVK